MNYFNKFYIINLILLCFFSSCTSVINSTSLAPKTPHHSWEEANKSVAICSKYCTPLIPDNLINDNLSLSEIIDIGLLNNPNTKATWAEAKSKAAAYGQSLSKYFPEIEIFGSYDKTRESNILPPAATTFNQETYTPEVNITYTIFDFGKRKNSSIAARQALYYADLNHNRQIQTVIKNIMDDYYDLQLQEETLVALDKDLYDANTSLDAAFEKFETGTGSIDDITQAKTNYLQIKVNIIEQKKLINKVFSNLKNDIGLPANISLKLEKFPEKIKTDIIIDSVSNLIGKAEKNRYDILASEADVKKSNAEVNLARSKFLPNLNSSFDLGKNYYVHHHNEDYHYTFLVKLTFPLFKGFFDVNELKKQKANLQKSKANLAKIELAMIRDVTTSHYNVEMAKDTLTFSDEYLETAKKRFDIAITKYKAGLNDILDVLSAQSFLQDARKKYVNAKKQWFTSIADLAYSTGLICSEKRTKL